VNKKGIAFFAMLILTGSLHFNNSTYGADSKTGTNINNCKDQFVIFGMIRKKEFNNLEQVLHSCQENYEMNANSIQFEIALFSAYEAFSNFHPTVEPALNEWVNKFPGSYVARAARGRFLEAMGYRARGSRLASDTSDEQFKAMGEMLAFATKDFEEAKRIYPKCLVAYCGLISINGVSGTINEMQRIVKMGLSVLPDSLMIRQSYLSFMEPKWGGTSIELDKIIAEITQSSKRYDKLHVLLGYRYVINAGVLEDQKQFDQALPLFLKALEYGDYYFYYSRLGRIYSFLHQYDQSIAAYTKAMQIGPVGYRTLLGRSYSLDQVGRRTEALKDVNLGLTLFPDDKNLLERRDYYNKSILNTIQQHSYSLIQAGSCAEALKEIYQGLTQFPDDKYLIELRDYCNKQERYYQNRVRPN
jgi:tetratricopeptide (TPR) repeat protein